MADEDAKSAKSRFKSKFNKVFKEREEHSASPTSPNPLRFVDDDVADFLKPSTDRAAGTRPPNLGPKIDVAIAQRWPSGSNPPMLSDEPFSPNGFVKARRRPGLSVGFVNTEPEFIAEGGDESEEPTIEVSRRKHGKGWAASERISSSQGNGDPQSQYFGHERSQGPRLPMSLDQDESGAPEERQRRHRAQAAYEQPTPVVQSQQAPMQDTNGEPDLPKLSRTPTGFNSQANSADFTIDNDDEHGYKKQSLSPPRVHTRFLEDLTETAFNRNSVVIDAGFNKSPTSPRDPSVFAARKREIGSGEGLMFRRATSMVFNDDDEAEETEQQTLGKASHSPLLSQHIESIQHQNPANMVSQAPEPVADVGPESAFSPIGPSPFADPNYTKRHTHDVSVPVQQPVLAVELEGNIPTGYEQPPGLNYTQQLRDDHLSNMRVPSSSKIALDSTVLAAPFSQARPRSTSRGRSPSLIPHQILTENLGTSRQAPIYPKLNDSNGSADLLASPRIPSHSRNGSRDSLSPHVQSSSGVRRQASPLSQPPGYVSSPHSASPRASAYVKSSESPLASATSTVSGHSKYFVSPINKVAPQREATLSDPESTGTNTSPEQSGAPKNFSAPRQASGQQTQIRSRQQESMARPSSVASNGSGYRSADAATTPASRLRKGVSDRLENRMSSATIETPQSSQHPASPQQRSAEGNPAADAAYADFAARVAHMKGVFRLTAERERPNAPSTAETWFRAALWWYHSGKAGLEVLLRQRRKSKDESARELLMQPHVDLAKACWILSDPLQPYDSPEDARRWSTSSHSAGSPMPIAEACALLISHIKSLSFSMARSMLLPPHQSLIQGQDTRIWISYPLFPLGAALALGSYAHNGHFDNPLLPLLEPIAALPLGDTRTFHCYGRFPVELSLNTEDAHSDRVPLPAILTMLRHKRDFGTTIVIASQSELVNIKLGPWRGKSGGLTWYDVSWKNGTHGMTIQLPHEYQMTVKIPEQDFRTLWNLLQYAHKVEDSLRPASDEILVHEAALPELQYADSTNADVFPKDKVLDATVYVFERRRRISGSLGERKMHRSFRLVLVTDPKNRALAYASHEVCNGVPLYFEYITDSAANGLAAMVIRIRDETRQCRMLLVLPTVSARQELYDVLNGVIIKPKDSVVGKMSLASMNIEVARTINFTLEPHPALKPLEWQKLGVNNTAFDRPGSNSTPDTVESESLRILARHMTGCITDRLNLNKGELLLRLPCANIPALQLLRGPQDDLTMSIDIRNSHAGVAEGITELLQTVQQQSTIRTFTFSSLADLHAFQAAITGCHVRYDGLASTFSIARRRMVVPIYKKWEAGNVRLQIVSCDNVVQVLAFMEDFSHTDAMCFPVRSTDSFENVKGDGKNKKWAVKMVDAKFSLPKIADNNNDEGHAVEDGAGRVRRRFVNLEGLEYQEEHDDLVVGFETQDERDRFAKALPAVAAAAGRGITLKRRT